MFLCHREPRESSAESAEELPGLLSMTIPLYPAVNCWHQYDACPKFLWITGRRDSLQTSKAWDVQRISSVEIQHALSLRSFVPDFVGTQDDIRYFFL